MVRQEKNSIHKCSRVEGGFSDVGVGVGCNGQLNSGSLHKQTRRNPLGGDVHSPVEDHDLCHHYQITLKTRHIHRVSEYDVGPSVQVKPSSINRMVTASAGVQKICLSGSPLM